MERNTLQKISDLVPGDRFHYPGKKSALYTVDDMGYDETTYELKYIQVKKDGDFFTKSVRDFNKEVIFLRHQQ